MEVPYSRVIQDDAGPLDEAIREGLSRPLLLWGLPGIGRSELVEAAAAAAGLPFRAFESEQFEAWDGLRDVTESGQFREFSLEKFLARGERADPNAFALREGEVLLLRDLNLTPTRLVQAVFDQILKERKLLNNPLPEGVRIVATAQPPDRHAALELLGEALRRVWSSLENPSPLKFPTFPLPKQLVAACDHWAVHPSLRRFVAWGRRKGLAEEVLRFLEEEEAARGPVQSSAMLHAHLLHKAELFPHLPSPRAFADLGALLAERRPCFSSRTVKDALARASSTEEFESWLHEYVIGWDADRWIEADSNLTARGESVPGNVWLRNMCERVRRGEARIRLADLPTFAGYERRSIEVWATQELGDEVGRDLASRSGVTEEDVRRLAGPPAGG